ncbi:prepilin-type N-terminal cleavage/methylation domain-containing protein [Parendozoicomonas sp. Alg238-R29]|uniref:PilW family protein n=1 Tax=Parendozoicomonas sp. Alg238-R29 TaxID=2993446 RepID=UPI00248DA3BF|nr:prepilin-type N-terminal cleavage/methylation domain-containing protein [Parendozoicomonas sp. Alg238-R29]
MISISSFQPQQKGISLIELMIALALGTLLVLGITRYSIDALQSQQAVVDLADIQDSARITMGTVQNNIQRGGYQGCGRFARDVSSNLNKEWKDRVNTLTSSRAVDIENDSITTISMSPLFSVPVPLIISADRRTITIDNSAAQKPADRVFFSRRDNTNANRLIIATCQMLEVIDPPAINQGDTAFTLATPIHGDFINLETNEPLEGIALYNYREHKLEYNANGMNMAVTGGKPKPFISNLETNGAAFTREDNGTYTITLNFLDTLRNDIDGAPPQGESEPGLYTTRVIPRNLLEEQR